MIGIPETGTLTAATISGVAHEGLTVTTADGRPAQLAIVDGEGNIIEAGPQVAREAWNVTLAVWKNFLIGKGYLRVFSRAAVERRGHQGGMPPEDGECHAHE